MKRLCRLLLCFLPLSAMAQVNIKAGSNGQVVIGGNGAGHPTLNLQTNGVNNANQSLLNSNSATPAAQTGYQNLLPQVDSSGNQSWEVPYATGTGFGIIKPDGTSCTVALGILTCAPINLSGGATGSLPYQSAPNTTTFISSPTTNGHIFVPAWQPTGSPIAPTAIDLGSYLGTNVTGTPPITVTPTILGFSISCSTCATSATGTTVSVNGGSTLGSLNINATAPVADASFLALTPKISGANMITEAPYATSSTFGVVKPDNTTVTISGGVLSAVGSGTGISGGTAGFVAIFGGATTINSGIALGSTGSDIPQLSSGLLLPAILPKATNSAFGAVEGDGSTITLSGGVVSCTAGSTTQSGCMKLGAAGGANVFLGYTPAHSGANSDITSLGGLTTPLSPTQGGTGAATLTGYVFGNGTSTMTASSTIPGSAISGNIPGNAANLYGTPTLPNGTAATTQAANDNSTKIATTAYVNSPGSISPANITLTGSGPSTTGLPPSTFSALSTAFPCGSNQGRVGSVSDSTTTTWGAAITGGGTNYVLAVCDGSAWTVVGK